MTILKVLIKAVGRAFYYENAGVFIIMFLLAFGFLSGAEHRALAISIASNNELLLAVMFLWLLYVLKTVLFFYHKLYSEEYRFIWNLSLISPVLQFFKLLVVQLVMNIPISLYALLVLSFSIKVDNIIGTTCLICFLFVGNLLPVVFYFSRFRQNHIISTTKLTGLSSKIFSFLIKPSWSWAIIGSLKSKPALWFISKPLGILLLIAFCFIDRIEQYDLRWVSMGVLIVFSTNLPILFELRDFHQRYLSIVRNLPREKYTIMYKDGLMLLTLILPEGLILLKSWPHHHVFFELISLIIFGFLLTWSCYIGVYFVKLDLEGLLRKYFFIFIILFVAILFGVSINIFIISFMILLILVYQKYYRLMLS